MHGPRVYTIEEVNELVPRLRRTFDNIEKIKVLLRGLNIRISALELIWGMRVHDTDCPDHLEFNHHLEEMKTLEDDVERWTKRITRLGGHVKSVDPPLVDFYGVREKRLVYWCWTRGEEAIEHWHQIDEGFASRQRV